MPYTLERFYPNVIPLYSLRFIILLMPFAFLEASSKEPPDGKFPNAGS